MKKGSVLLINDWQSSKYTLFIAASFKIRNTRAKFFEWLTILYGDGLSTVNVYYVLCKHAIIASDYVINFI